MNIKKKILSLAVITGLTFSCVPQAQANAGHKFAALFLTSATIGATYINVIPLIALSSGNQFMAALAVGGLTTAALAEFYEKSRTYIREDILEGILTGCWLGLIGISIATMNKMHGK